MNTQKITIAYAWKTPYSHGAIHETREDAEDQDRRDAGETLLRLYINSAGRIVHTEEVPA